MTENNDYSIILKHLEKLEGKIDGLATGLQQTNIEMAKLSEMKHALQDIKSWKENIERIVNPEDLREMKKSLSEIKKATENVEKVEEEVERLKRGKEDDKLEIDKLKTFKTKAVTIGTIFVFIITTSIAILGLFLS